MSYTPIPGSLADRVCAYFRRHSDEELSADDIALKFEALRISMWIPSLPGYSLKTD